MRVIYGCPENFRDSLITPTATYPKILWVFVPMLPSERAFIGGFYRPSIHIISTRLLKILDCSFEWGFRTPNLGEWDVVWGREWYHS